MPGTEDEIERFQRIRDQQIQARDPSGKRERYQRQYRRQRSARKGLTLKSIMDTFSNKLKGLMVGIVLGLVVWILLSIFVDEPWIDWAGLGAALLLSAVGILVGASFDWRDNMREF